VHFHNNKRLILALIYPVPGLLKPVYQETSGKGEKKHGLSVFCFCSILFKFLAANILQEKVKTELKRSTKNRSLLRNKK